MSQKDKLRGKDLLALGYEDGALRSLAMITVGKAYRHETAAKQLALLKDLIAQPQAYLEHVHLSPLARRMVEIEAQVEHYEIRDQSFAVYGAQHIEPGALTQMRQAMSLPVSIAGALMPDAHQGYGLPIGGVLAVDNAYIPYGVGVDIGCRMCLSIWDRPAGDLERHKAEFSRALKQHTRFGLEIFEDNRRDDELLEDKRFEDTMLLRGLKDKAYAQIGSSGGGNHFVEFGRMHLEANNPWGLAAGEYLALLSHSGSRGMGARIADHYTKLAMRKRKTLPKQLMHLAWLGLDEAEGQEYRLAMQLAGDYASANHRHIHERLARALGLNCLERVENHHNYAWEETLPDGRLAVVHRKGATPAQAGVLGIIPGSMTAPAYLVQGKGLAESLQSASHGAGRLFSRRQALESISKRQFRTHLQEKGVELIGGGLDESPFAYKDIETVMQAQQDLVDILGRFYPKIVRMDAGKGEED